MALYETPVWSATPAQSPVYENLPEQVNGPTTDAIPTTQPTTQQPVPTTDAIPTTQPTTQPPDEETTTSCLIPDPVSCDVENTPTTDARCNLVQGCADDFDWTRISGRTPSSLNNNRMIGFGSYPVTGPLGAQGGFYYMYVEATGKANMDTARMTLRSNVLGNGCLQFYYTMNGFHIGALNIYKKTAMAKIIIFQVSGDQSPLWEQANVNVHLTGNTEIIFEAVMTGQFAGDIAVDSITIGSSGCTVSTFSCDMEQMPTSNQDCNLVQDYMDDFDWTRNNGSTPSSMRNPHRTIGGGRHPITGPRQANGGQHYIYVEATGRKNNDVARVFVSHSFVGGGKGCFHFWYNMNGRHIGRLTLYAKNETMMQEIWSLSGEQSTMWQRVWLPVDLWSMYVFEATMTGAYAGDIALDDIFIENVPCSPLIWGCQFETEGNTPTTCNMTEDVDDHFNWTLSTGPTPTRRTGPTTAYSGPYYIYTEASSPRQPGHVARILTPPLPVPATGSICVQFRYHMSGSDTGTLLVFTRSPSLNDTDQWVLSGQHLDVWLLHQGTLHMADSSMVGFSGKVAAGYEGDIAVDDIEIYSGICDDTPIISA